MPCKQELQGLRQSWPEACNLIISMDCVDQSSQALGQLLEAAISSAVPRQQHEQEDHQGSQQLSPSAVTALQISNLKNNLMQSAAPIRLLKSVVSADTPDQLFSALDAFLGSALQQQEQPLQPVPLTSSISLLRQQQRHSSRPLPGSSSRSCFSSSCVSSPTEECSSWAGADGTATLARGGAAGHGSIAEPLAPAPVPKRSLTGRDNPGSSGFLNMQQPCTTTSERACKRMCPLAELPRQQQGQAGCVASGFMAAHGAPAAASAMVPAPNTAGSTKRAVPAPGACAVLHMRGNGLTWQGSCVSYAPAAPLLAECDTTSHHTKEPQQQHYQAGKKRRLAAVISPCAACEQDSVKFSFTTPQQQPGRHDPPLSLAVPSNDAAGCCGSSQPPSPTTAAAAAATATAVAPMRAAASSSHSRGASNVLGQRQQQQSANPPQAMQRCSPQLGCAQALLMSMHLMHYAE